MAVRYRPRGLNVYPGRRVAYVFANEITEARGIPPKTSYGTVIGTYGSTTTVLFDGNDYMSHVPVLLLSPEDDPALRLLPTGWFRRHSHRSKDPQAEKWKQWKREDATHPLNPDLVDRAIARYGPRSGWRRTYRWSQP